MCSSDLQIPQFTCGSIFDLFILAPQVLEDPVARVWTLTLLCHICRSLHWGTESASTCGADGAICSISGCEARSLISRSFPGAAVKCLAARARHNADLPLPRQGLIFANPSQNKTLTNRWTYDVHSTEWPGDTVKQSH